MRALRWIALLLAVAALLALAVSGPGTRFDVFSYRIGLQLFRWAAYLGLAAALVAVVALAVPRARRAGIALPVLALLVGLAVFYVPFQFQRTARSVPSINDITTDTEHPPQFMTAPHPYPGADFARRQQAAYPELRAATLPVPPAEAFKRAVAVAQAMGWEVVGEDPAAGRIEAVDTTHWFGFRDDIAVRVAPAGEGSRVDVRSRSRVGRNDLGTNARRIRAYLERLRAFGGTLAVLEAPKKGKQMRKTALILALAITVPAWGQDKPAEKPAEKPAAPAPAAAAQEAPKAEAAKAEAPQPQAKKPARKHTSKRMEDARHCLDMPTNTEIIKCAEAYL
jgi:hypothetical protein